MQRQSIPKHPPPPYFAQQIYIHSRNESVNNSKQKYSARKPHGINFPNMDKLIEDVKITQIKQNCYSVHIQNMRRELEQLKGVALVREEVLEIEGLIDRVDRKVWSQIVGCSGLDNLQGAKKPPPTQNSQPPDLPSPLKHIQEGNSIAYTKLSSRQLGNLSYQNSTISYNLSSNLQTPKTTTFQSQQAALQLQNINNKIDVLQSILKNKGFQQALQCQHILKQIQQNHRNVEDTSGKLQNRQFESAATPVRKDGGQRCRVSSSKEVGGVREGKIKVTQAKLR